VPADWAAAPLAGKRGCQRVAGANSGQDGHDIGEVQSNEAYRQENRQRAHFRSSAASSDTRNTRLQTREVARSRKPLQALKAGQLGGKPQGSIEATHAQTERAEAQGYRFTEGPTRRSEPYSTSRTLVEAGTNAARTRASDDRALLLLLGGNHRGSPVTTGGVVPDRVRLEVHDNGK